MRYHGNADLRVGVFRCKVPDANDAASSRLTTAMIATPTR
jgi:hypothetical protein